MNSEPQWNSWREALKKARYSYAFLRQGLVHTNLQILYDCNFRCKICDFWRADQEQARRRMSASEARLVSDKLARIGPQIVSIGGGEPLLHPEIMEIVSALSRHHIPVMICNGWYMTKEIARELFQRGMYEISISIDYADAEKHDRQRGMPGAFERAQAALRCLAEQRVHPEQRVHMISVVMEDNLEDIEKLARLSRSLGVTYLLTLYSDNRGNLAPRRPALDVSAQLLALKARHPEFVALRGYLARFTQATREGGIGDCKAGKNLCNVDSQGNVSLCIDRLNEPVGNLFTQSAEEVLRRLHAAHRVNRCGSCWTSCRGTIETLMYGEDRGRNLWDYYQLAKPVPLGANPASLGSI